MKNQKIPIDEIISVGGSLISDKPPTTFFGRVFRILKKLIQIKDGANIKIEKQFIAVIKKTFLGNYSEVKNKKTAPKRER